jgi:hypothetical protein
VAGGNSLAILFIFNRRKESVMFLKTTSHRSREKLARIIGEHPQYYFTVDKSGSFVKMDDPELIARALEIKGITKCRDQNEDTYMKCWETGIGRAI